MNSVVRQLWEQDTDVVMVDTGNSYEGLCEYVGGKYISYTEDHPITMNPFRINKEELNVEKIGFLKNLVLLIWKGPTGNVSKEEDKIVNMVIEEYFDVYFHPENRRFSEEQRIDMARSLRIDMRAQEDNPDEIRRKQERLRKFGQVKKRLEYIEDKSVFEAQRNPDNHDFDNYDESMAIVRAVVDETGFSKDDILKYSPEELCDLEMEQMQDGSINDTINKSMRSKNTAILALSHRSVHVR